MKKVLLVSGAEYWDFEQEKLFTGYYQSEHLDDKGKLIGYDFEDEQGQKWIISNSHSISKALELVGFNKNVLLGIEFKGKIVVKSTGKPFNKFEIYGFEDDKKEPEPKKEGKK